MHYQFELKDNKYFELNNLTDLAKLKDISEVFDIKVNISEIAKELGVDRRTAKKYYDGYQKPDSRIKPSRIDKYIPIIKEVLSDNSLQKFHYKSNLYNYLVDNYNMDVSSSTFRHFILRHEQFNKYFSKSRATSPTVKCMRYETDPGQQIQVDWKENFKFLTKDMGVVELNIFVILLSYSRYSMYYVSLDKKQDRVIFFLADAFEKLGGVSKEVLTDNLKTVMDKPRTAYQKGTVNAKFNEFAKDYGFKVRPCIAKRPQTKGKVESQMKILDELDAYQGELTFKELLEKIEKINTKKNINIHQGTLKSPISLLETDKDFLNPLPNKKIRSLYRIGHSTVKVNESAMISYKSSQYSVPNEYIGKSLNLEVIDNYLYLYDTIKLVTKHKISSKKLNYHQEHYLETARLTMPYKDKGQILQYSKENLKKIGKAYETSKSE